MRTCNICGRTDECTEFRSSCNKTCRSCLRERERATYHRNREQRIASVKEYAATHKESRRDYRKRWERKVAEDVEHKQKIKARNKVNNSRNLGHLDMEICAVCGELPTQAHHYAGYDDPLKIQWLCARCHTEAHNKVRRSESYGE